MYEGAEANSADQGTDESFDEILGRAHRNNYDIILLYLRVSSRARQNRSIVDGDGFHARSLSPKDSEIGGIQFRIYSSCGRQGLTQ